ncbi:YihY/virulence factor BrkB family protein [Cupriavidus gilardii]|uniref:YihY/virulence factor BrkB family protein n=1 Tax=Cupriavidus gilardii TaxID=82541 RepID=UPI00157FD232|nr:YihY/virulence factor BrkB family protein [Cupriavidus gilardii]MCT9069831.1 YihY/virulence factor BrkB family protein [Cupriavidus gilardii]MCT9117670.1 YihY/virulence factor BrkB family protein [Cupriavidus gilardii]MCT9126928.1 YihY/virulence factor BrkB family protein [Cupriavidus gilardii]QKS60472.1 YihY/virulence factor BrkB family protein [Cupriavidus gilardii]
MFQPDPEHRNGRRRGLARMLPDRYTLRRTAMVVTAAVQSWFAHRAASKGAALSFYMLFSLAPILVLVISIAGLFFGAEAARGEIFAQLEGLLGTQGAAAIQQILAATHRAGGSGMAALIATGILIVGATSAFAELKASLDDIWEADATPASGWRALVRTRLLSFGLVLVLALMLLVSLVVNAAIAVVQRFWDGMWFESWLAPVATTISSGFSFIVVSVLFAVVFKMLPRVRVTWRDVTMGAIITAVLFSIGKRLIGIYLGNSAVASSYGAAGSVVALMLWVYYSAQIFFFGAELTHQYALQFGSLRERQRRGEAPEPVGAGNR